MKILFFRVLSLVEGKNKKILLSANCSLNVVSCSYRATVWYVPSTAEHTHLRVDILEVCKAFEIPKMTRDCCYFIILQIFAFNHLPHNLTRLFGAVNIRHESGFGKVHAGPQISIFICTCVKGCRRSWGVNMNVANMERRRDKKLCL